MKVVKRNAVIITVLLFVCTAAYLNWSYDKKTAELSEDTENSAVETDLLYNAGEELEAENLTYETNEAGLYYSEDTTSAVSSEISEYFSQVRLERTQARDEASATLETVATSEGASQETIDEALQKMTSIADWTVKEAELENLIMAKGFLDCVVYMSDDGVSVTVSAEEGLSTVGVAKITDIILSETEFTADQLKVIEIK
jgi:stage III sporulation protein AH